MDSGLCIRKGEERLGGRGLFSVAGGGGWDVGVLGGGG